MSKKKSRIFLKQIIAVMDTGAFMLRWKKEDWRLSEKVIRRLMKQVGVQGANREKTRYSSYRGEITPAVPNLLKRDFHANRPNEKWLTDITEFAIPAGKVYLSPIINCLDGMSVCWRIGTSPSAELTNGMLDKAIYLLKVGEHPIVHTDRGCHYRWPGWSSRMDAAYLHRSMFKKGDSPDNSACEGFFGRMKNEMFYGVSWLNISIEEFIHIVEEYMVWYQKNKSRFLQAGLALWSIDKNSVYRHSPRFCPQPSERLHQKPKAITQKDHFGCLDISKRNADTRY